MFKLINKNESGFVYLAALFAVAIIGLGLSLTGQKWSDLAGRERELELLSKGTEIMNAIEAYKKERGRYPKNLKVLVKDKRGIKDKRYLRKLYKDPLVLKGKREWQLIKDDKKVFIVGVKSNGIGKPFKTSGFSDSLKHFEGKTSYSDWEFVAEKGKVDKVQSQSK